MGLLVFVAEYAEPCDVRVAFFRLINSTFGADFEAAFGTKGARVEKVTEGVATSDANSGRLDMFTWNVDAP